MLAWFSTPDLEELLDCFARGDVTCRAHKLEKRYTMDEDEEENEDEEKEEVTPKQTPGGMTGTEGGPEGKGQKT
jgi:hypothetical protein